ncbi:MAG: hypothetical protein ABEJ56_01560 [Candidatus Nanohaloarchaea archaeon]
MLEKLKNLVQADLNIDLISNVGNTEENHIHIHSDDTKGSESVSVNREEGRLDVNIAELDEEQKKELFQKILPEEFEEGRVKEFYRTDVHQDIETIEENQDDEDIADIVDYFGGLISERHLDILEDALFLREIWRDGRPIDEKKRDLRQEYGKEGVTIVNFCTAEYFDQGGYLRELHKKMRSSDEYTEGDYREEFEEIVRNAPFSVFVSYGDNEEDIKDEVKQKLQRYQKYGVDIEFVDVRGIGGRNIHTIEQVIEALEEETDNLEYRRNTRSDGELRIRIDTDSVEGLTPL